MYSLGMGRRRKTVGRPRKVGRPKKTIGRPRRVGRPKKIIGRTRRVGRPKKAGAYHPAVMGALKKLYNTIKEDNPFYTWKEFLTEYKTNPDIKRKVTYYADIKRPRNVRIITKGKRKGEMVTFRPYTKSEKKPTVKELRNIGVSPAVFNKKVWELYDTLEKEKRSPIKMKKRKVGMIEKLRKKQLLEKRRMMTTAERYGRVVPEEESIVPLEQIKQIEEIPPEQIEQQEATGGRRRRRRKRTLSGYTRFIKLNMPSVANYEPKERMSILAEEWRNMTPEEQMSY